MFHHVVKPIGLEVDIKFKFTHASDAKCVTQVMIVKMHRMTNLSPFHASGAKFCHLILSLMYDYDCEIAYFGSSNV